MSYPFILGLTGGIGMGKSSVAAMMRDLGIQVVHDLYDVGGAAVPLIEAAFANTKTTEGSIDRSLLSKYVVGNPEALKKLENIVHPLVHEEIRKFLQSATMRQSDLVVLDIPLLFETNAESSCDAIAVVCAPPSIQRERVLARSNMTLDKLNSILSRQFPDEEKRKRADFIIDTGVSLIETNAHVSALIDALRGRSGKACKMILQ